MFEETLFTRNIISNGLLPTIVSCVERILSRLRIWSNESVGCWTQSPAGQALSSDLRFRETCDIAGFMIRTGRSQHYLKKEKKNMRHCEIPSVKQNSVAARETNSDARAKFPVCDFSWVATSMPTMSWLRVEWRTSNTNSNELVWFRGDGQDDPSDR